LHLLLVEDDLPLAEAICDGVRQLQWQIAHVADAETAKLALAEHGFDAILLDIGLPGASGLALLRWMRERYDSAPVLILTARGQLSDRIKGLDSGADDYLVKPFQFDELFARIRALTRRSRGQVVPEYISGEVRLDPEKRLVTRNGERVMVSVYEYRTLLALFERQKRIVTRDQLQQLVYDDDSEIGSNTIAVFIHQLRRKLGEHVIETVHGHGYTIGTPKQ
jgi:two-component system OmpR family response regulator